MRFIRRALGVVMSAIGLLGRRLIGVRVRFHLVGLVSWCADLITEGKTACICIGRKTGVRKGVELHAVEGRIEIGNGCFINRNCLICAHQRVRIEDGVTIGPGTYIYDHDHDGKGGFSASPVVIGRNTWIGAGCIILKGVTIGENAVVAAGAVVTKPVAPGEVVGGVPARGIGAGRQDVG